MQGWQERRTSFGSVAADYAALRPGYPADAVAFLLGDRPRRVLDLGAGTGLLTDVLLAAGHEVLAVDLSGPMLDQLRARLPQVVAATGGAESIPLPDADVDAVVAGQAAHWFDPVPAAAELRRVLRPGGVVGFVWNTRDETVPWVRALGRPARGGGPRPRGRPGRASSGSPPSSRPRSRCSTRARCSRSAPSRWCGASAPAATSPRWTTPGARGSSTGCATCSTRTPTPGAATSWSCPTRPGRTASPRAEDQPGRWPTANTRRKGSTVVPSGRTG